MIGEYSLRKIAARCKTDIRFMAFQRLISHDLKTRIQDIFEDINLVLKRKDHINDRVIYIDGTKEEANANKFTFVWRANCEKSLQKSKERAEKTVKETEETTVLRLNEGESPASFVVRLISEYCRNVMRITFVYGRGRRKNANRKKARRIGPSGDDGSRTRVQERIHIPPLQLIFTFDKTWNMYGRGTAP
jgi:hypothetical protein